MLVDTHCHLDMLEDIPGVLMRMASAGVERAVTIGVDAATNETSVGLAEVHDQIWATVGLHPHQAKERTEQLIARMRELAARPRVVGIGEAGLDYHYDNSPREQQRSVFAEQVALAGEVGKTLVIHSRSAWDDTFSILEEHGPPERFVFHCFSGGPVEAERALTMGAHLSFSGIVTFPNAGDLRAAARLAPLERLVIETDSPFLTPVPHRGKANEPAFVRLVAATIAAEHGLSVDEVASATSRTAAGLFGWS